MTIESLLEGLPEQVRDRIVEIVYGSASVYDCLRLASICCELQRAQDHNAYTGACHEPIDVSPLIVSAP